MSVSLFSDTQNTSSILFSLTNSSPFKIGSIFLSSDNVKLKNIKCDLLLDGTNLSCTDAQSSIRQHFQTGNRLFANIKLPANAVVDLTVKQLEEPLSNVKLECVILTDTDM